MLPISELVRVTRSCDDDWHSPLADLASARWPWSSTARPVFVRSSANHVFVTPGGVLRLRPDWAGPAVDPADLSELADRGAPVARPLASRTGRWTERVRWSETSYDATALELVEGDTRGDDLPLGDVAAWGAGLAMLHAAGSRDGGLRLPRWPDRVPAGAARELEGLPRVPSVFGVVHGDPELDNVVWTAGGSPVFVDLDDASLSWFAADIAFALRDFAAVGAPPSLDDDRVRAFVSGYRQVRPLTEVELSWLPRFARLHAAIELVRLQPVISEPVNAAWPEWAMTLAGRIQRRAEASEAALAQPPP